MMIQRKVIKMDNERKLLTNMIISTDFLREIYPILRPNILKSPYARLVAQWVIDYYSEYKEAPERIIQDIFLAKKKFIHTEDDTELIAMFLSELSKSYEIETDNLKYTVDQAIVYIRQCSLESLKDDIEQQLSLGNLEQAEQKISTYSRVVCHTTTGVNLLDDSEAIVNAFSEESEYLFRFPGEMGQICGSVNRGDFIAFLAFTKRGKSWALLLAQEQAMAEGRKVLNINLEMTQNQTIRRIWQSLAGRPRWDCKLELPHFVPSESDDKPWTIDYEYCERKGFPTDIVKIEKLQLRMKRYLRSGKSKLLNLPADSITVDDLEAYLDNLEHYDNFIPDVLIVDYADLLSSKKNEYRHKLDEIWKGLRSLALDRNIAVVSASQSNRFSANKDVEESDTAEDIRKVAHVTKMIGINQNRVDRANQVFRMEVLAQREGSTSGKELIVLSCLDIGKIYLDARMAKEVVYDRKEEIHRGAENGIYNM